MPQHEKELLNFLQKPAKTLNIVTMPDFFQDRIVNLDCNLQQFTSAANSIVQRKGGSIDQIPQTDIRGGNAANVTSALAALGAKVTPIICTSTLGKEQLRFHFKDGNIDTTHIKTFPKASVTTALEFKTENGKANLMIRDLGSLAEFGPADLTDEDYKAIEKADYVCVFNWAGTRKFGTELAQTVFRHTKMKGKGKTYLDTADPTPNKTQIPTLLQKVLKSPQVDILSLNENEAVTYASMLSTEVEEKRGKIEFNELALLSAQILAKHLQARIDLHTTTFSVTVTHGQAFFVPAFKAETLRVTGAGDAWDAGNILGDANNLPHEERLTLANAAAACYLSDPEGTHPTRQRIAHFLESQIF